MLPRSPSTASCRASAHGRCPPSRSAGWISVAMFCALAVYHLAACCQHHLSASVCVSHLRAERRSPHSHWMEQWLHRRHTCEVTTSPQSVGYLRCSSSRCGAWMQSVRLRRHRSLSPRCLAFQSDRCTLSLPGARRRERIRRWLRSWALILPEHFCMDEMPPNDLTMRCSARRERHGCNSRVPCAV